MRRFRSRLGQASTEYMMAVSVVVLAAVAAGYQFHEPLRAGFQNFSQKFETFFAKEGGPQ